MVLDDENAYILHETIGRKVPVYRKGHAFVMRASVGLPNKNQKNMKDKAAALGELGSTWQED